MTITPNTPLTGPALADALYAAGLAPPEVFLAGGAYCYPVTIGGKAAWEPWRCIADSWHLVLRYRLRIELDYCGQGSWVWHEQEYERAAGDGAIAAAICRLSVRLHQVDVAREGRPCPP